MKQRYIDGSVADGLRIRKTKLKVLRREVGKRVGLGGSSGLILKRYWRDGAMALGEWEGGTMW